MTSRSWWRLAREAARPRQQLGHKRKAPRLEALEDRTLLSAYLVNLSGDAATAGSANG